jgi:hypothetical protein
MGWFNCVTAFRTTPDGAAMVFTSVAASASWKDWFGNESTENQTTNQKFLSQELAQISAGIESELNKPARTYRRGQRAPLRLDLLVEVYFKDGRKGRILLHLEIQNERDPFFDERLFIYHYRIFDKTRDPVIRPRLAGSWPGYVFTGAPLRLPAGHFGLGHGGGAHAPDEYYVIESANPKVRGMEGATRSYVEYLFELSR